MEVYGITMVVKAIREDVQEWDIWVEVQSCRIQLLINKVVLSCSIPWVGTTSQHQQNSQEVLTCSHRLEEVMRRSDKRQMFLEPYKMTGRCFYMLLHGGQTHSLLKLKPPMHKMKELELRIQNLSKVHNSKCHISIQGCLTPKPTT
jgi:hypothetical protein